MEKLSICFEIQPPTETEILHQLEQETEDVVYVKAMVEVDEEITEVLIEEVTQTVKSLIAKDLDLPITWFTPISLLEFELNSKGTEMVEGTITH